MKDFDKDASGCIDLDEFTAGMEKWISTIKKQVPLDRHMASLPLSMQQQFGFLPLLPILVFQTLSLHCAHFSAYRA
jgi:hypothetical protein